MLPLFIHGTGVSNNTCNTGYVLQFTYIHVYRDINAVCIFHTLLRISLCMLLFMLFNTIVHFVFHVGGYPEDALSSMSIFTIATFKSFGLVVNEKSEVIFKVRT